MNKRGNLIDMFKIMIILIFSAVMLIAGYIVVSTTNETGVFSQDDSAQDVIDSGQNALLYLDTMMMFLFIGLSIWVIISSGMVWNHPVMLVVSLLILFVAIIVAGSLSNSWFVFSSSSGISPTTSLYPKMDFLLNNLPFYILFMGSAACVSMFITWRQQQ